MSHDDRAFAQDLIDNEGFTTETGDFLTGPAVETMINGEAVLVRQCYAHENFRWEGFVSIAKSTPTLDSFFLQTVEA